MTKRTTLASATLASLPAVMTAAQHVQATALTNASVQSAAQWGFALGMEGYEAVAWGVGSSFFCYGFAAWGGLACSVAGVL